VTLKLRWHGEHRVQSHKARNQILRAILRRRGGSGNVASAPWVAEASRLGQRLDWHFVMPPLLQFFEELKTHPNLPYVPSGEGVTEIIPKELQ
jgi:hypothetical protein